MIHKHSYEPYACTSTEYYLDGYRDESKDYTIITFVCSKCLKVKRKKKKGYITRVMWNKYLTLNDRT